MNQNERYDIEQRKAFFGIDEKDGANMRQMKPLVEQQLGGILEGFYSHLRDHPETARLLQSDGHVSRLKDVQKRYFIEMTDGVYDTDYMDKRLVIGRVHERIGLEPQWYIGAYALYLNRVVNGIFDEFGDNPEKIAALVHSIVKIVFLDMGFAVDTYIDAMVGHEKELKTTFIDALTSFSAELAESTSGIVAASTELSASAAQQAAMVSEVTATISEVKETSRQSLDTANSVIGTSTDALQASETGTAAVEEALQSMHAIQGQVETIAEKILNLSEQTQRIGEIIGSVGEIAGQSKLLALNAAIEAARAGEHGRGFSVVAGEIRSLAEQSRQATQQVGRILGEIQKATNTAVIATEEGSKRVDGGVELANRAGDDIHTLADAIREAADAARLIASTTQQQSAGVEQVAEAMLGINESTNQTAAGLKQTELSAVQLARTAERMNGLIEQFSKPDEREVTFRLA